MSIADFVNDSDSSKVIDGIISVKANNFPHSYFLPSTNVLVGNTMVAIKAHIIGGYYKLSLKQE